MLSKFDEAIEKLSEIPLHPQISQSIAVYLSMIGTKSVDDVNSVGSASGRNFVATALLDGSSRYDTTNLAFVLLLTSTKRHDDLLRLVACCLNYF